MKAFDAEGNEIEVFSQEELTAKIEEEKQKALADAKKASDDAEKAKADADAAAAGAGKPDDIPAWAQTLITQVQTLATGTKQTVLSKYTSGLDADKKKDVETRFESLSGYEDTPEGQSKRAADAYLLVTNKPFNAGEVNMPNLMAAGGAPSIVNGDPVTPKDKEIQSVLGITSEDVAKYTKK